VDGWIKLHRKIVDSEVFHNPELLRLWIWILTRAAHHEHYVPMESGRGSVTVKLNVGELVIGRNKTARDLNLKPSTFRNRISKLESLGMIRVQPATNWSVISICNWNHYQTSSERKNETPQKKDRPSDAIGQRKHSKKTNRQDLVGQAEDRLRTGLGQAKDTYKKVKTVKTVNTVENTTTSSKVISFGGTFSLVSKMAALIQDKSGKPITEAGWLQLVQAAHVGQELAGTAGVVQWVETAREKSKLSTGYFVACALRTAKGDGEDFDAMKRDAPRIPFEPPPMLAKREPNRELDFERERSRVIIESRERGEQITDDEADHRAKERIVNNRLVIREMMAPAQRTETTTPTQ